MYRQQDSLVCSHNQFSPAFKAKNSLKEAVLEGGRVFRFPSTGPSIIPLLYVQLQKHFGLRAPKEAISVLKWNIRWTGLSPGSTLSYLPREMLLKSPLKAMAGQA